MSVSSFDPVAAVLLIPIGSAALLAVLPGYRLTARLNVVASLATFLSALSLFVIDRPPPGPYVLVDDLNIVFIVLNTFVGFTTSIFSASYIAHELETGRLTPVYLRFYHAMYQIMMFGMNLAFVSNNIGLMWVAVEIATLTTVLMVGIYRTHAALEAAWKYFILGSVGIAFALFGTILVYMAARPVVGEGQDGMVWTLLIEHAAKFDPALLNVAFVFLFLGYGTKVGLAPLHAWLPDAHAEGPTPISAVLSGLLLNVALYALLRFKILLAANPDAIAPGPLMVTMGLVSLIFAAFMLYRRRDIKRLFAYSSIEHMGIIVFAFGMGGPLANFAGLLHMVMHSLTKSAIFYAVGHISQIKGTQRIAEDPRPDGDPSGARLGPGGRRRRDRRTAAARHLHERVSGRELDLRAAAAAGDRAGVRDPAGLRRIDAAPDQRRVRRTARQHGVGRGFLRADVRASRAGAGRGHLSSRAARRLVPACRSPSWIVEGLTGYAIADRSHAGGPQDRATRPVAARRGRCCTSGNLPQASWRRDAGACSAFGANPSTVHMAIIDGHTAEIAVISLDCPDRVYPSVGQHHPPALRLERTINDLFGLAAEGLPDTRPWLDHDQLGRALSARRSHRRAVEGRALSLPAGGRRRPAPDRGRSGACRASSSPDISALPPAARPWSGWNSGWDIPTRASRG